MTSARVCGVLVIATGGYTRYLPGLLAGLNRAARAVDGPRLELVCFSDQHPHEVPGLSAAITGEVPIRWLPWGAFTWPLPTLLRFEAFSRAGSALSDLDHLLYLDVDMAVRGALGPLVGPGLVAVTHPGYSATPARAPFVDDPTSGAHVPADRRIGYVCGGVQGGRRDAYLAASDELAGRIRHDLGRGHIPRWHDESYWNAWIAEMRHRSADLTILPSEYCWPEEWVTPTQPGVIIALRKPVLTRRRQPPLATARDIAVRGAGSALLRLRRPAPPRPDVPVDGMP